MATTQDSHLCKPARRELATTRSEIVHLADLSSRRMRRDHVRAECHAMPAASSRVHIQLHVVAGESSHESPP